MVSLGVESVLEDGAEVVRSYYLASIKLLLGVGYAVCPNLPSECLVVPTTLRKRVCHRKAFDQFPGHVKSVTVRAPIVVKKSRGQDLEDNFPLLLGGCPDDHTTWARRLVIPDTYVVSRDATHRESWPSVLGQKDSKRSATPRCVNVLR